MPNRSEWDAENVSYLDARLVLGVRKRAAPVVTDPFGYELEVVRGPTEVLAQCEVRVRGQFLEGGLYTVEGVSAARGRKGIDEVVEVLNGLVTYGQFVAHP